jgi:hypothetical protein
VNMLSQFQVEPRQEHWIVAKHILRYLRGTITYGLRYASNNDIPLRVTFEETRIFREARETLNSWLITLEDKSAQETNL